MPVVDWLFLGLQKKIFLYTSCIQHSYLWSELLPRYLASGNYNDRPIRLWKCLMTYSRFDIFPVKESINQSFICWKALYNSLFKSDWKQYMSACHFQTEGETELPCWCSVAWYQRNVLVLWMHTKMYFQASRELISRWCHAVWWEPISVQLVTRCAAAAAAADE